MALGPQQVGRLWAHLFGGARCSCDGAAGACDERAPEPGFLTSAEVPSQRGASLCSRISQPKGGSRTTAGTTLPPSSLTRSSYSVSTFVTSADSPSPGVALPHGTCGDSQPHVSFILLRQGDLQAFPPLFLSITLLFRSVCRPEQGRSSLQGRNIHQKTSLRPHAERLIRGRGLCVCLEGGGGGG